MLKLRKMIKTPRHQRGFSLIEVLIVAVMSAVILAALATTVDTGLDSWEQSKSRGDSAARARFAMQQMVKAVRSSPTLLIPSPDDSATAWNESSRSVLAVTLDPSLDRNNDGFADADNDKDGLVDEDLGADAENDGASGIVGLDDNGDGASDGQATGDDDEDGVADEDPADGLDNDGDGRVDEDTGADMNQDGAPGVAGVDDDNDALTDEPTAGSGDDDEDEVADEDWLDVVAYYLNGTNLMERIPNLNPITGADFTEQAIASDVTAFTVIRHASGATDRAVVLELTLTVNPAGAGAVTLSTQVRLNGGR